MPLTVYLSKNYKFIKFTLPDSTDYAFPPLNLKFQYEENDFIRFAVPNKGGLIPYPTDLSPILLPPLVPDPLTFIGVQHNFLLGNQRLILAPPTRYGCSTFSALAEESAHRHMLAQQQPIVSVWNAVGGREAANASTASAATSSSAASAFPASTSAASAFASAFSRLAAVSRSPSFSASVASPRAHASPPSPLPMSEDENEKDEESEDGKDEDGIRHGSAFSTKDEKRHDGY